MNLISSRKTPKSALNSQVGNRGRFTPSEGGNALQENPRRNKKLMDVGNPDTNPEQDCNCLNEKESIEFLKKMKETEEREPTEKEKEMAEGIKEIAKCYCPEQGELVYKIEDLWTGADFVFNEKRYCIIEINGKDKEVIAVRIDYDEPHVTGNIILSFDYGAEVKYCSRQE